MSEHLDKINRALSIPAKLTSEDGREFLMTSWSPTANCENRGLVRIKCEMIVKVDGEYVLHPEAENTSGS